MESALKRPINPIKQPGARRIYDCLNLYIHFNEVFKTAVATGALDSGNVGSALRGGVVA